MSKRAPRTTRKTKEDSGVVTPTKEFNTGNLGYHKIQLTDSQQVLANKIIENDLTFCVAPAGTGKTLTVFHTFCKEYMQDKSKKLIYIRTPVEAGMDKIGALPDGLEQKIEPHFASAKQLLELLLGKGKLETDLGHRIIFKIPNFCLGATFDNSIIVIDEAQQLPPLILKLLLERTGINSKVIVLGDNTQLYVDARNRNALLDAIPRFFDTNMMSKYPNVVYHSFDVEDVMRSDLVKTVIRAYS